MSNLDAVYSLFIIVSFLLGILFGMMDGTLLWSIGFFALGMMFVLFRMIWSISGWADRQTRKYFD